MFGRKLLPPNRAGDPVPPRRAESCQPFEDMKNSQGGMAGVKTGKGRISEVRNRKPPKEDKVTAVLTPKRRPQRCRARPLPFFTFANPSLFVQSWVHRLLTWNPVGMCFA